MYMDGYGVDVACITEHWMCKSQVDIMVMANHKISENYHRSGYKGGGVLILTRSDICCKEIAQIRKLVCEQKYSNCSNNDTMNKSNYNC